MINQGNSLSLLESAGFFEDKYQTATKMECTEAGNKVVKIYCHNVAGEYEPEAVNLQVHGMQR